MEKTLLNPYNRLKRDIKTWKALYRFVLIVLWVCLPIDLSAQTIKHLQSPPANPQVNIPATATPLSKKPEFVWWRDFPWTPVGSLLGGVFVIIAAGIQRNGVLKKITSDEGVANKNRESDNINANKQLDMDKDIAKMKELHEQFVDIQNRLALSDPSVRANAVLRIGIFGTTALPHIKPNSPIIATNYPYFLPVVSQLATMLTLEENPSILDSVVRAISGLTEFAKHGINQHLLHSMLELLSIANISAKKAFVKSMAEWVAGDDAWEDADIYFDHDGNSREDDLIELLATISGFCSATSITVKSLYTLRDEDYKAKVRVAIASYRRLQETEKVNKTAMLLPHIEVTSQQLRSTRDALSNSLQALVAPEGYDNNAYGTVAWDKVLYKRSNPISLDDCFLAGADLRGIQVQGGSLRNVCMQSANLFSANLQCANLLFARIDYSDMTQMDLRHSLLADTSLVHSRLIEAQLQGAVVQGAKLSGADLSDAQLENSQLFGVIFDEDTMFNGANWQVADFASSSNDKVKIDRTNSLKAWLAERYSE